MRKNILIVATLTLVSFLPDSPVFAQETAPDLKADKTVDVTPMRDAPASFADLVETLTPAVVNISSTQKATDAKDFPDMPQFPEGSPFEDFFEEFMERRGRGIDAVPQASLGSGFIVDAENGYIITNNHVIRDADEVNVTLWNDETLDAEIIGVDEKTDIAVLKVDPEEAQLAAVEFGRSDILRVGDWIVAIGNPFGLGGTVTAGIISARQRDINSGPYDDYLQTDASINRGNSGGPMFNMKGEVIGINTAIFSPTGGSVGIGFAIPSDLAKPVVNQIIKYGRTRRGWLGVRIQTVTDEIAESLDLPDSKGALVASITPDGPAEKSGLQHGDIILKFNGEEVDNMRSLPRIVAETPIGESVEVEFWRESKLETTSVEIGELEKAEEEGLLDTAQQSEGSLTRVGPLALGVKPLTEDERTAYNVPATVDGVMIGEVDEASEAEQKGLMPGDVIVEINQQSVKAPEDVNDIVNAASNAGRSSVLLLVNREGDVRFVALRLE